MKKINTARFLWDSENHTSGIKYPYVATISEEILKHDKLGTIIEYKRDNLGWLICPEDVVMSVHQGKKIYKLVEMTDEEIDKIHEVTKELLMLDN